MLNEIPFAAMDEYAVELRQSVSVAIPSNSSLIAAVYLSPVMNLGGMLSNLAQQYALMRIDGVSLEVAQQNQIYSTVEIAYDPTLAKADIAEMLSDLTRFYADGNTPFGVRIAYFTSSAGATAGQVEINGITYQQKDFATYTNALNRIKRSMAAQRASALPDSAMTIAQPGFRLCPMANTMPADPIYRPGMEYVALEYAADFITDDGHMQLADADSPMPVYGKFYYAMSNTYEQPVDQILTVRYSITCKHRRDGSSYRTPSGEPWI